MARKSTKQVVSATAPKVDAVNTSIAFAAGYNAAENNKTRAPAHCKVYMTLIVGFAVGDGAAELGKTWLKGYQTRCDEEAAAILAS